jgi:hypothetical protein
MRQVFPFPAPTTPIACWTPSRFGFVMAEAPSLELYVTASTLLAVGAETMRHRDWHVLGKGLAVKWPTGANLCQKER